MGSRHEPSPSHPHAFPRIRRKSRQDEEQWQNDKMPFHILNIIKLKWKQQRQDKHHHNPHDDL